MAFTYERQKRYALADTYKGPTTKLELEFSFIGFPGFATALGELINGTIPPVWLFMPGLAAWVFYITQIRPKFLYYTIEKDERGTVDKWRVILEIAEEPEQEREGVINGTNISGVKGRRRGVGVLPFLTIVAIGVAISIVLGGAAIAYRISKGDWGPGGVLAWGPILILGGLGLFALTMFGGRLPSFGNDDES